MTQSSSLIIRDLMFDKVASLPFFAGFVTKKKSKAVQVQPENLPFLGVYIVDEQMDSDGDHNAGEVRFIHKLKLGYTVMAQNSDSEQLEDFLDESFWAIMDGLWKDPILMNFWLAQKSNDPSYNPNNVRIEGVSKGTRKHVWGNSGVNETPIGEMQYEPTVIYRSNFPPEIVDELNRISVKTGFPTNGTPEDRGMIEQLSMEYDFTMTQPTLYDRTDDAVLDRSGLSIQVRN